MLKLSVLIFTFLFITSFTGDIGVNSESNQFDIIPEVSSSLAINNCVDSTGHDSGKSQDDCHDCLGHCHSSHSAYIMAFHQTIGETKWSEVSTNINGYNNLYISSHLSRFLRPPIFS